MLNKYYDVTVSKVGIENNRVDKAALFQVVRGVSADDIFKKTLEYGIGNWELVNGSLYVHYDREGNGYTDEWIEEAEKRGLYNLKSTPDALPMWIAQKNIDLFTKHSIFTSEELHSRYEIWLENYSKTINIESNTMVEMVQKDLLPSVMSYIEEIASTASLKASVVPGITCESETALITKLSELQDAMTKGLEKLKSDTAKARATEDVLENAKLYQAEVLEDMAELRKSADEAETLIPDDLLPYPTYGKLLFYI